MPTKTEKDETKEAKIKEMQDAATQAEQEIRAFREAGGFVPAFEPKDQQTIQLYLKAAAMAKYISKTPVLVKLWRGGKVELLTEPVGNYDDVFRDLLSRLRAE